MNINDAALRYLSSRSRTVFEMKKQLGQKGFTDEEIGALIADFRECGYLDDLRYCQEYFHYAFGKGKGKRLVFNELREKGIDQADIDIAFEEYDLEMDEVSRAREEAAKVLRMAEIEDGQPVPEKIIGRIARKLQSKGYSSDTIYNIIGDMRR
ncbi:regulatory protein RecX [Emergencia sp.]|uniref:regulatory protein RecX n=1 Tax=Emergencia sp. TaxID=1926557 RepID=UPI003AEF21BC